MSAAQTDLLKNVTYLRVTITVLIDQWRNGKKKRKILPFSSVCQKMSHTRERWQMWNQKAQDGGAVEAPRRWRWRNYGTLRRWQRRWAAPGGECEERRAGDADKDRRVFERD